MKIRVKNFVILIMIGLMILSIKTESVFAFTKKEIQKEIKSYQKVVDANYKDWQNEKKKYKKQTKGSYLILKGEIINKKPMIIQDSISGEYFYVKSGTSHISSLGNSVYLSYIKNTKKHTYLRGYYCTIASGVKVNANPDQAEALYKENKEELDKLKASLKVTIKTEKPERVRVDQTEQLMYELSINDDTYTEVKVVSHSDNIEVDVDVDYFITIKGLQEGDAYVTLKCDSSEKTKTLKFHVYPGVTLKDIQIEQDVINYEIRDCDSYLETVNYNYQPKLELEYYLKFNSGDYRKDYKGEIIVSSSDDSIIEVISNEMIKIKDAGTATVTISSGGISKTITYNISRKSTRLLNEKAEREKELEEQRKYWEELENGEFSYDQDEDCV